MGGYEGAKGVEKGGVDGMSAVQGRADDFAESGESRRVVF
jgi:hypothetical protein